MIVKITSDEPQLARTDSTRQTAMVMRRTACHMALALACLTACRSQSFPEAPKTDPVPERPRPPERTQTEPERVPTVRVEVRDLSNKEERPVALKTPLKSLATKAAKAAGFHTDSTGDEALVEFMYALVQDNKMVKSADRGLVHWGARVTLLLEDEHGLTEELSARSYGESPWVRDASPDLNRIFQTKLLEVAQRAFRNVLMQLQYRNATAAVALDGLASREAEEHWAAMKRIGELSERNQLPEKAKKQALEAIVGLLERDRGITAEVAIGVLTRIGGDQAKAELLRISKEHNSKDVKKRAADVLKEVLEAQ